MSESHDELEECINALSETIKLLRKLREASNTLDYAYLDLCQYGKNDMTGEKYDEINDVFIEVDEYLDRI